MNFAAVRYEFGVNQMPASSNIEGDAIRLCPFHFRLAMDPDGSIGANKSGQETRYILSCRFVTVRCE
jgi:hypothetical protein